jgi:uncharacterized protein with NAD-binding domain and iron-sulfur cluster
MGKRVVIAGGGIAGMTAAMLLAEQGFEVVLCEASGRLGGKAKSGRTPEGNPTEHSVRLFFRSYRTLLPLLGRIPAGGRRTILDNLVGVPAHFAFAEETPSRSYGPPTPLGPPGGRWRAWVRRQAYPWTVLLRTVLFAPLLARRFRRHGVSVREALRYTIRHARLLWTSPERLQEELGHLSYAEYLGLDRMSEAARRYFAALPQVILGGRAAGDARQMTLAIGAVLLRLIAPPPGLDYLPARMMTDGPTSERLIAPWAKHLSRLGVCIHLNSPVAGLDVHDGRVNAVRLTDGRRLEADHFVLALSYLACRHLLQGTKLSAFVSPGCDEPLRLEWSNGIQVFLKSLPDGLPAHFAPGVAAVHLDSPWLFGTVVQGPGFWRDVEMAPGTRYVLSATCGEPEVPGPVTGKPMTACTVEEIVAELLTQCGFPSQTVIGWHTGEGLEIFEEADYQARRASLPPHLSAESVLGRRTVTYVPIPVRTPGGAALCPRTCTKAENLFLAGEFVRTQFDGPCMESAAESGWRAAAAIANRCDVPLPTPPSLEASDNFPFRWLRRLDGWLYRLTRRRPLRRTAKTGPDGLKRCYSLTISSSEDGVPVSD